jgi:hypothetical protein
MTSGEKRIFKEIPALDGERVVLLDWTGQPPKFCNLLKLAPNGAVLWTAEPKNPLEGVWSDVSFEHGQLVAYNMAGYSDLINYDTGRILRRRFVK